MARTMLAYERLVAARRGRPACFRRDWASDSLSPDSLSGDAELIDDLLEIALNGVLERPQAM